MATTVTRMKAVRNALALFLLHAVAVSGLTSMSDSASAQATPAAPPHVPLQKSIGTPAKPELVPSLFVLSARGATLQSGKLVLTGLSPNSIVFADRPVRSAGHELTAHILEEWLPSSQSADSFYKDPLIWINIANGVQFHASFPQLKNAIRE